MEKGREERLDMNMARGRREDMRKERGRRVDVEKMKMFRLAHSPQDVQTGSQSPLPWKDLPHPYF